MERAAVAPIAAQPLAACAILVVPVVVELEPGAQSSSRRGNIPFDYPPSCLSCSFKAVIRWRTQIRHRLFRCGSTAIADEVAELAYRLLADKQAEDAKIVTLVGAGGCTRLRALTVGVRRGHLKGGRWQRVPPCSSIVRCWSACKKSRSVISSAGSTCPHSVAAPMCLEHLFYHVGHAAKASRA
jgi:hypothetical protein